jgi:alanine racemase
MHSLIQYVKHLYKPNITPMNVIALSRSALLSNYHLLQTLHPGDALFPVLKSNAYGHGIKEIASILKEVSPAYICVDSFPEYQVVRDVARCRSLILGETLVENYHAFDPRWATLAVSNIETLKVLIQS